MKIVGDKLAEIAVNEPDSDRQNLFGRSAFNRYYYSAYWITRGMITIIAGEWNKHSHEDIPNMLNGNTKNKIDREIQRAVEQKTIEQGYSNDLHERAHRRLEDLADLMREAYAVRIVADYQPENLIEISDADLMLENCTLASANGWEARANYCCDDILSVWEEIGHV